jgi:hypothetical protein
MRFIILEECLINTQKRHYLVLWFSDKSLTCMTYYLFYKDFFFMLVKLSTNHVTVMADSDFLSCNLTEHEIVDYDNTGSVIIT